MIIEIRLNIYLAAPAKMHQAPHGEQRVPPIKALNMNSATELACVFSMIRYWF
jgi:hypothetical protein